VVVNGWSIYRHVNSGGSFGASPLCQTIGLGKSATIDKIGVFWPPPRKTQVFSDLPVDRTIYITEGSASPSIGEQHG
jgi:hypothetical protein